MSTISKHRSLYLDLFDDGLYDIVAVEGSRLEDTAHFNLLRLQALCAILFRRTMVVPEQWAVSSATFLKLAAEVLKNYERTQHRRESRTDEKFVIAPFPFELRCFRRNGIDPRHAYLVALAERAAKGHRIQLGSELATNADGGRARRAKIEGVCRTAFEGGGFDNSSQNRLVDSLCECLTEEVAQWIGLLAKRVYDSNPDDTTFLSGDYSELLGKYVGLVQHTLASDAALRELSAKSTEQFLDFFKQAHARRVDLSRLTQLWEIAKQYDVAGLIVGVGRYVIHRAMAEKTDSDHGGFAAPFYFEGQYDDYARLLLERTRHHQQAKRDLKLSDTSLWVNGRHTAEHHQPAWPAVWDKVWESSVSKQWDAMLGKLNEMTAGLPPGALPSEHLLDEVLDAIVNGVDTFQLSRNGACLEARIADDAETVQRIPFAALVSGTARTAGMAAVDTADDSCRAFEFAQK